MMRIVAECTKKGSASCTGGAMLPPCTCLKHRQLQAYTYQAGHRYYTLNAAAHTGTGLRPHILTAARRQAV